MAVAAVAAVVAVPAVAAVVAVKKLQGQSKQTTCSSRSVSVGLVVVDSSPAYCYSKYDDRTLLLLRSEQDGCCWSIAKSFSHIELAPERNVDYSSISKSGHNFVRGLHREVYFGRNPVTHCDLMHSNTTVLSFTPTLWILCICSLLSPWPHHSLLSQSEWPKVQSSLLPLLPSIFPLRPSVSPDFWAPVACSYCHLPTVSAN